MRRYWSFLRHSLGLAIGAAMVAVMAVPGAAFAVQVPLAPESHNIHHSLASAGSTSMSTLGVVLLVVGVVTAIVLVGFAGLRRAPHRHATVVQPRLSGTES
jgi:heme/copper-type cytochrome/quinol oxidase subunit 2